MTPHVDLNRQSIATSQLSGALAAIRCDPTSSGQIRAAFQRASEGTWRFVIGRIGLPAEGDVREEIYRDYAFVSRPLRSEMPFVDDLLAGSLTVSPRFPAITLDVSKAHWQQTILPSNVGGTGLPTRRFSTRVEDNAWFSESQLLGYEKPYRISAAAYLKEFLGLDAFTSNQEHKGELLIDATDHRGAI